MKHQVIWELVFCYLYGDIWETIFLIFTICIGLLDLLALDNLKDLTWTQLFCTLASCTTLLCLARLPFEVAWWSHCLQGYLTCSCTALLCLANLFLSNAWWPQISQIYFASFLWKVLLWIFIILIDVIWYLQWSQLSMFILSMHAMD